MNETILLFLLLAITLLVVVSIALKNDNKINEINTIINSDNLSEEQKIVYLSIINTKNSIKKIEKIAITILLIILIPIMLRIITLITGAITFNEIISTF